MTTVRLGASLLQRLGQNRRAWLVLLIFLAPCLPAFQGVAVAGPKVLYSFSAPALSHAAPSTNSDGVAPASSLVLASDGYLYGTTRHGGTNGAGFIFRITTAGSLSDLHSFRAATNNSGEIVYDLWPNDLVQGMNGDFYGTTRQGGTNFTGTIFEISSAGIFTNLHTFAAETTNSLGRVANPDGMMPVGALVPGTDGNFYGTTQYGGSNNTGTIFRLTPAGVFTSLYSFGASTAGAPSTNGAVPNALALGSDGAFYGTTQQGGLGNAGTFFKFTLTGGFTQIYSFNGFAPSTSPNMPNSTLVQGLDGYFYGTSAFGGSQGGGTIFVVTNTGGVNLLHSFPLLNAGAGASLSLSLDGNFYGTFAANGVNGEGAIFRITPAGDFGAYYFNPLDINFDNAGGANPLAGLTPDSAGNLYGTCAAGGTNGSGVIFQIYGPDFIPPSFLALTNSPPTTTNVLVGATVTFSNLATGFAPLTYQWLKNGTNLVDSGDVSGSQTNVLTISPVFPRDVGSYALLISNTWGAVTSSVTTLTVSPPGILISSPLPNARTNAPVFAGTATLAPLFTNISPGEVLLTHVLYSVSNFFNGSNITGISAITAGASNWTFSVTPFPGTNLLSVQSVDVSGNISPVASELFFYEVPAHLTILTTGSGTAAFSITNGAMLNLDQNYSDTASPISSVFNNWMNNGVISFNPAISFVMQSNLVLTANFSALQLPVVTITSPAAKTRTNAPVFRGTASASPLLAGVNSNNIRLTNVVYWLTNSVTGSVLSGATTLTQSATVSNWSFAVTPLPGTNTLAVQCKDVSGDLSHVVSQIFFYTVPSTFILLKTGVGNGTFTSTASVPGDTLPTNNVKLNLGESYTITAKPDKFSTFAKWVTPSGSSSSPTLTFLMQSGFTATATFSAILPQVAIISPTANQRTAAPIFNGTASGGFRITNVSYSLANIFTGFTSNGSATLLAGPGSVSNWFFALKPSPGTNTLTVQCTDVLGDVSAAVSRTFFYEVPSPLTVAKAGLGNGTFTLSTPGTSQIPFSNSVPLDLGQGYTITATPDHTSLFSNWVSSARAGSAGNSPVLPFIMQTNLVLTATFIPDFFPAAAGIYNGLFYPSNAVAEETSGMLYNLVLLNTGTFSGKLLTDGTNYQIAANFDASGHAAFTAGPLQVALTLNSATPQIIGTVSTSQWTANLLADLASNVLPSQEYTILFSPPTNPTAVAPPGDGYALVTNVAGMVTLSGALADGSGFSQTVPVSQAGNLPIYASLYTNSPSTNPGLVLGWINLTNLQAAAPTNSLVWIKKPARSPGLYTNGFTNILSLQGSPWTNPPVGKSAILLTNGQLVISNSSLTLAYTNISVSNNTLLNLGAIPTNYLTGSITPKTGLLTLTFTSGGASNHAAGVILQNATNAGGYLLTSTNAGAIHLQP